VSLVNLLSENGVPVNSLRGGAWFGMLEAYFDESGKSKKTVVVSGYFASPDAWHSVIRGLGRIFAKYRIDYLHMKEIRNQNAPHYSHLSIPAREKLLRGVARQLRQRLPLALSVTVDLKEYEDGTSQRFRSQLGSAYTAAATAAILMTSNLLREQNIMQIIGWTFESGHANEKQLFQRLARMQQIAGDGLGIGWYGFTGRLQSKPLQAADVLANSVHNSAMGNDGMLQELLGANDSTGRTITKHYHVHLSSALALKALGPIAEEEARRRKWKKSVMKTATQSLVSQMSNGKSALTFLWHETGAPKPTRLKPSKENPN